MNSRPRENTQGSPLPWYKSGTLWLMAAVFLLLVVGCVHLILVSLPVSAVDGDRPRGPGTVLGVPMSHTPPAPADPVDKETSP